MRVLQDAFGINQYNAHKKVTIMRLTTLNPSLAKRFAEADTVPEAQMLFERLFFVCFKQRNTDGDVFFGNPALIAQLRAGAIPAHADFERLRNELDARYFDAGDAARDNESQYYFAWARLMAALCCAQSARSTHNFAEAAYEAIMSLGEPFTAAASLAASV